MLIKRHILEQVSPWLGKEKILILKGARQVGKTTILQEIKNKLTNNSQKNQQIIYLMADDLDNQPIFESAKKLELYLQQFYNLDLNSENPKFLYLIIDEFQYIQNSGLFLKNFFDKHKNKMQIIVSGSSSLEISKTSEFLTGRAIHFNISRISFLEYFEYLYPDTKNNIFHLNELEKNFIDFQSFYEFRAKELNFAFENYIKFGAYPEVLTTADTEEKKIILKSIIQTYIEKDIVNFLRIENVSGFNNLVKILMSQIGNLANVNELSNTTGLAVNTVKKYLNILIGTYIFDLMTPFYKNTRSEINKMPKIYALDLGIRNYMLRQFEIVDFGLMGGIVENFVYLNLLQQFSKDYIHFYRTISGSEIDFVLENDNGRKFLCEVKFRNKISESVALKNFEKKYSDAVEKKIIITKNLLDIKNNIYYIPAVLLPFVDLQKT
jgi:uncharacterized protein